MNRELTIELLKLYLGDGRRPNLKDSFPTEYAGSWWNSATNAYHFIMIKQTEENTIPAPDHTFPALERIIPELNCNLRYNIQTLTDAYNSIPIIEQDVTMECQACDGEGEFDHEGYTYECKSCNETGFIKTGQKENVLDPEVYIMFNGSIYNTDLIKTMLIVLKHSETKELILKHNALGRVGLFFLDDTIIIGIMPVTLVNEDDNKVRKHIKIYSEDPNQTTLSNENK